MNEFERMKSTYQGWLDAHAAKGTLCATCHWWAGWTEHESARCSRPGGAPIHSIPEMGCCSWEREPGSDDEIHPRPLVYFPLPSSTVARRSIS